MDAPDASERILRAAVESFTHYGVIRTTTSDVARIAGLSRATVYRYFPGPQALHGAVMDVLALDVQREVEALSHPDQPLAEFVRTFFAVLTRQLVRIRARQHLLEERETIPWAMYQSNEEGTRRFIGRLLRGRLAGARRRGELSDQVTDGEAVETLWIAVRAMTSLRTSPVVDLDDPEAVGQWFTRLVFRGIGPPEPTRAARAKAVKPATAAGAKSTRPSRST